MIVQHKITPTIAFPTAIGIPDTISQIIFASRLTAPPPYMTSFPNGQKDSPANLKHCRPIGIPMIVMHHKQPAAIHASPLRNPPQINHNIFPRNLIICFLLSQFVWAVIRKSISFRILIYRFMSELSCCQNGYLSDTTGYLMNTLYPVIGYQHPLNNRFYLLTHLFLLVIIKYIFCTRSTSCFSQNIILNQLI